MLLYIYLFVLNYCPYDSLYEFQRLFTYKGESQYMLPAGMYVCHAENAFLFKFIFILNVSDAYVCVPKIKKNYIILLS